jgi:hypothetical protein
MQNPAPPDQPGSLPENGKSSADNPIYLFRSGKARGFSRKRVFHKTIQTHHAMLNIDLWHRFTESFGARIRETKEPHLASAWSNHKARTNFYREMLKPLAVSLGTVIEEQLETGSELFKVDFAISRNSDSRWFHTNVFA